MSQPTLETKRLILRPLTLADAKELQTLASDALIAETTFVPHPYPEGLAEKWISGHSSLWIKKEGAVFGVVEKNSGKLVGVIELIKHPRFTKGELSYWIGVPYWGRGYCTEAAFEMTRFGFENLELNKICSRHVTSNPSSGRVMQKIGMTQEGLLRQDVSKNGKYFDLVVYGILKNEF